MEALFYRTDRWLVTRPSAAPPIGDIQDIRLGEPDPLFVLGGGENQIQGTLREGRKPHPASMRRANQNPHYALNRKKAAPFNRR